MSNVKTYRERCKYVKAIQWTGNNIGNVIDFLGLYAMCSFDEKHRGLHVRTDDKVIILTVHDYIIMDESGNISTAASSVMSRFYEQVDQ